VWPIESAVAEWLSHRGNFTAKGYEIGNIMGPNEWVANAANESMVNLLSKITLHDAIEAAHAVGETPPSEWARIEKAMYLPIDPVRHVIQPFSMDGPLLYFNEPMNRYEKVDIKEHPAAYTLGNTQMLVFHDPPIAASLYRSTYEYEEKLRAEQTPNPSVPGSVRSPGFSIPPFAACAAMFGERTKAADLFRTAATQYSVGPFLIGKEYRQYNDGNYVTNQASLLLAAMYGFTGLRISTGDWRKYPVSLPEGWTRIEMQRIWIHGKAFHLIAEQGKELVLDPIDGLAGTATSSRKTTAHKRASAEQ
jgi:trehalose/maltose hydrolase-like predicted phosphorylase